MTGGQKCLAVLGGGQLGMYFARSVQRMGRRALVVDPDPHCPAATVADVLVTADFGAPVVEQRIAQECSAVTVETENVPPALLERLAATCLVTPDARALAIAQNRIAEKDFLASLGLKVAPYAVLRAGGAVPADIDALLPGILKRATQGYDGKGQTRVSTREEVLAVLDQHDRADYVLEKLLDLRLEVSLVLARGADRSIVAWPVAENHHRHGILELSIVPARVSPALCEEVRKAACAVAEALDYQGVLCVEFFVTREGRLVVNEIAPRPHNSGHFTIDACATSQFDQQARIAAGAPLGDTTMRGAAVMRNLVGRSLQENEFSPGELAARGIRLHLYGKAQARPGRKMGHYTCVAADPEAALEADAWLKRKVGDTFIT